MIIKLYWDDVTIPTDGAAARQVIHDLELSSEAISNLWALWSALDALLDHPEDVDMEGADADELANCISDPDFISTAMQVDADFDWSALPDWVRAQSEHLSA